MKLSRVEILLGLAVTAIVLGFWGALDKAPLGWLSGYKALLFTLQFFLLNVPAEDIKTWPARIASLLAPTVSFVAAISAFRFWLLEGWRDMSLQRRPADELFIGAGFRAASIALSAVDQEHAKRVVALDLQTDNALARAFQETDRRIITVTGDARVKRDLQRANAAGARVIWVLTDDDLLNLEIARQIITLLPRGTSGTTLLVSVDDLHLIRADHLLRGVPQSDSHVEYFNAPRLIARFVWLYYPPVLPLLSTDEVTHVAVVGEGDLVAALVVHAAVHWIVDENPRRCVRVSLIGRNASDIRARLMHRHPMLDPKSGLHPSLTQLLPVLDLEAFDFDATELSPRLLQAVQSRGRLSAVYVAADHDQVSVNITARMVSLRDAQPESFAERAPIVGCLQDRYLDDHGHLFQHLKAAGLIWFSVFKNLRLLHERYPGAERDHGAALIQKAYEANADWKSQSEEFRWSNRLAADHMNVKHAWLERKTGHALSLDSPELTAAIEKHKSSLMRLEHRRFVVERLMDGWLPSAAHPPAHGWPSRMDNRERKRHLRLNATLVAFDDLDDADKAKDEHIVNRMVDILKQNPKGAVTHSPEIN